MSGWGPSLRHGLGLAEALRSRLMVWGISLVRCRGSGAEVVLADSKLAGNLQSGKTSQKVRCTWRTMDTYILPRTVLGGSWDVVSRLITRISRVATWVIGIINLLTKPLALQVLITPL